MKKRLLCISALMIFFLINNAYAATIDATYEIIDTTPAAPAPGEVGYSPFNERYLIQFTVTNNIPAAYGVYRFDVDYLSSTYLNTKWDEGVNYPTGWEWGPISGGGGTYWRSAGSVYTTNIPSGDSLSEFSIFAEDITTIPDTISFKAYAVYLFSGGEYDFSSDPDLVPGSGNFSPQFTGTARLSTPDGGNGSTVPEPTTMVLFGFGLLGLSGIGRREA